MRDGEFGQHLKQAGIVVIGDYNLVGSRNPLDVINSAGMTDRILLGVRGGAASTWRGITKDETFWPGRLDIVTYSQGTLDLTAGLVVDTTKMTEESLRDLGLRADDSRASDHLMLIADFRLLR